MRVYHFLDRKYGLDDIRRRRLKIATLDDLNDPFEMLAMTLTATKTGNNVRLSDAAGSVAIITGADSTRSNGIIHQIDTVFSPSPARRGSAP